MIPTKYFALVGDELSALEGLASGGVVVGHVPFRDTVAEAGNDAHRMAKDCKVTVFKVTAVRVYGPEV